MLSKEVKLNHIVLSKGKQIISSQSNISIDGDDVLRDGHGVHHDVRDGDCDDDGDLRQQLLPRWQLLRPFPKLILSQSHQPAQLISKVKITRLTSYSWPFSDHNIFLNNNSWSATPDHNSLIDNNRRRLLLNHNPGLLLLNNNRRLLLDDNTRLLVDIDRGPRGRIRTGGRGLSN